MNTHTPIKYLQLIWLLTLLPTIFVANTATAKQATTPFNRIVLMIDASGSYKQRQAEAVEKADGMLQELAQRKSKRWEKGDQLYVISLDALPEVIWQGAVKELKSMKGAAWQRRFRARTDYAGCTDVGAGFQLAARLFEQEPEPAQKYLLVFSDLKNEPPTTAPNRCRAPVSPSLPPDSMPWDPLSDVSVTVFWMPAIQKFAWYKVVIEKGLDLNFNFYTTSESGEVELKAPPVAHRVVTKTEQRKTQRALAEGVSIAFNWLLLIVIVLVVLAVIILIVMVISNRRRSQPQSTPSSALIRPLSPDQMQSARRRS